MFERIKAMQVQLARIKEINQMTERDLMDLDITRDQLLDLVQLPEDSPERLAHMAALLGMADADLKADHAAYIERLQTCGHCADRSACAKVLAERQAVHAAEVPFCPNAAGIADELAHPLHH